MSSDDCNPPDGFRQIPGFPRYAIDQNGTVLSICGNGRGSCRNRPWSEARRLTLRKTTAGYYYVMLYGVDGKRQATVHTLVLESFVGHCPGGMECRHLDGSRTNNHISNLAWGTRSENCQDAILHGTFKSGSSKLIAAEVLEVRRRRAIGEPLQALADEFGVSKSTICEVANRRIWKHIV